MTETESRVTPAQRIIEQADKAGDFVVLEDGETYYYPKSPGAFSPWVLRALADELDRRNGVETLGEYIKREI